MRKLPIRTCVACRQGKPKNQMLRVVRTPQGEVIVDRTGKCAGIGAYVCDDPECIAKCAKRKLLDKAFGVALSDETYAEIQRQYEQKS